jgi:enoyl-CoA hydratase
MRMLSNLSVVTSSTGTRSGDQLRVSLDEGACRVEINRPDSLNAVTADVLEDMADTVEDAGKNPDVRLIVLSGAGRAFCSGADIGSSGELSDQDGPAATLDGANRLVAAIRDVPRPVVSVVQGPCAGVGVSIALSADLVLASSKAFFMLAFTKIGLMPDGGATALVAASAGRAKAMRMALLAERLTAEEAASAGLVSHVFDADAFESGVDDVVSTLRSGPMVGYARTKHAINAATLGSLDAAFALEREGQLGLLAAADFVEGTTAFNEKRTPVFGDTP